MFTRECLNVLFLIDFSVDYVIEINVYINTVRVKK